jgi:hypothetical protein
MVSNLCLHVQLVPLPRGGRGGPGRARGRDGDAALQAQEEGARGRVGHFSRLALFTTLFCSHNTPLDEMTSQYVHVTNLTPGSDGNPSKRRRSGAGRGAPSRRTTPNATRRRRRLPRQPRTPPRPPSPKPQSPCGLRWRKLWLATSRWGCTSWIQITHSLGLYKLNPVITHSLKPPGFFNT